MWQFDGNEGAFRPWREAADVWADFLLWWERRWPGRPLPQLHNLPALTGLSERDLKRLLAN